MKNDFLFMFLASILLGALACSSGGSDSNTDSGPLPDTFSTDAGVSEDAGLDGSIGGGDTLADGSTADGGKIVFTLNPERVYDDIKVLASEKFAGRLPGTEGNAMAVELVQKRFESLGLVTPVKQVSYLQPFKFKQWSKTAPSVFSIADQSYVEETDFFTLAYSGSAKVTAELVFAGYGIVVPPFSRETYPDCILDPAGYDDYAGLDVKDKIVIVLRRTPNDDATIQASCPANPEADMGEPETLARFDYKARNAINHGALAVIFVQNYLNPPDLPEGAGLSISNDEYPAAIFANRDLVDAKVPDLKTWAGAIDSALKPNGKPTGVTATVEVTSEIVITATENVIGVIPGSDPLLKDETVVIGAHLDHLGTGTGGEIYYGADDNASGLAVMMELAKALVESGKAPARTVVFAGWNGEEEGLLGSCYYVIKDPLFPIEKIKAAFSVDMVGLGNGTGLYLYGATETDKSWIADLMAGAAAKKGLEYFVEPAEQSYASDHACFAQAGAAGVMAQSLTWDDHWSYHTPGDTSDAISIDTLRASIELLWATIEPLAAGTEGSFISAGAFMPKIADVRKSREAIARLDRWK